MVVSSASFRFSPCIGGGELGAPPGDASGLLACDSCGTASDFGGSLNDDFPGEKSSLSLLAGEVSVFKSPAHGKPRLQPGKGRSAAHLLSFAAVSYFPPAGALSRACVSRAWRLSSSGE
jgi:hypothetical protein